jgi:hypothetical protein
MIGCLHYHIGHEIFDSLAFGFDLTCRALSFDEGHKLLHTKFEIFECFYLALSETYFNWLELLLQELTENFLCLPNIFLFYRLLDLLKFYFECRFEL